MTNPIAHLGSACIHGGAVTTAETSVLAGTLPIARKGDAATCAVHGPVEIASASRTVLVGGVPAARVGDLCRCPGAGGRAGAGAPATLGPPSSLAGFGVDVPTDAIEAKRVDIDGDGVMDGTQYEGALGKSSYRATTRRGALTIESEGQVRVGGGSVTVSDLGEGGASFDAEGAALRADGGAYVSIGDRDVLAVQGTGRVYGVSGSGAVVNGPLGLGGALEGKGVQLDGVGGVALIDPSNEGNWVRVSSTSAGGRVSGQATSWAGENGARVGGEYGFGAKIEGVAGELELTVSRALFGSNGYIPLPKKAIETLLGSVAGEDVAKEIAGATLERSIKGGGALGELGTPHGGKAGAFYDRKLDRAELSIDGYLGELVEGLGGLRASIGKGRDPFERIVPEAPAAVAAPAEVAAGGAASADMGPNVIMQGVATVLVGS